MTDRFSEMTKGDCLDRHLAIIGNMWFPHRAILDPVFNVSLSVEAVKSITRQTITALSLGCLLGAPEAANSRARREEADP